MSLPARSRAYLNKLRTDRARSGITRLNRRAKEALTNAARNFGIDPDLVNIQMQSDALVWMQPEYSAIVLVRLQASAIDKCSSTVAGANQFESPNVDFIRVLK